MQLCGSTPLLFGAEHSLGGARVVGQQRGQLEKPFVTKILPDFPDV